MAQVFSWRRVGDTGVLVELADLDEVLALDQQVRDALGSDASDGRVLATAIDVVPAARTLLVTVPAGQDLARLAAELRSLADGLEVAAGWDRLEEIELPVHYDGPDLQEVASLTGLTVAEVVAAHTGTPWRAAFGGFAPGFTYLVGGDPRLQVPRRSEPRTAVPPGSVALAGEFSAVYPRSSPGGWQLLGQVDVAMWDVDRDPPALVRPGMRVRFVDAGRPRDGAGPGRARPQPAPAPVRPAPARAPSKAPAPATSAPQAPATSEAGGRRRGSLTVLETGPMALLQDRGRPGLAHLGVGRSGAADRGAHALGQRLLGNDPDCAAIELTLGGLVLTTDTDCLVTVTGAPAPAELDGGPVGHAAVLRLGAGRVLRVGAPAYGLRSYVSVRGGIHVPPVLGSRSTDTLAGLGPEPLRAGDELPLGEPRGTLPALDQAPLRLGPTPVATMRLVPGPRADWLADPDVLIRTTWEVSSRSDRIGARLTGATVARHPDHHGQELPTEGVARGSVQVPAGGEPVLFLADHPVTGGYPVAAVVLDADLDRAAQLRPGDALRFAWARPGGSREPC
ncbi:hypothetical protein ADJ73_04335 [Arsenicicoccus sp. oral taxon 190]|nr:hypothetical protein ADJ73_04335 [Arsenicicoccus sp. oral taxon 190]